VTGAIVGAAATPTVFAERRLDAHTLPPQALHRLHKLYVRAVASMVSAIGGAMATRTASSRDGHTSLGRDRTPLPDGNRGFSGHISAHDYFWGFSPALCPRRSSGKTSDGLRCNISTISAMRLWTTHSIDNMAKTNPNQQVRPEAATAAASLLGPRPNQMMGLLNLLDHDPAVSGDGTYGAYDAGSQSKGTLTMINNTISTSYQTLLPTSWT